MSSSSDVMSMVGEIFVVEDFDECEVLGPMRTKVRLFKVSLDGANP